MKNILMAILLLAVVFAFFSCQTGDGDAKKDDTATTAAQGGDGEDKPAEIPDNLPEMDFKGYNFRIFIRDSTGRNKDFVAEEENGDTMNDVVYRRNRAVADRFGAEFSFILTNDDPGGPARTAILSGDDAFDLIAMHGAHSFQFSKAGLVMDWLTDMPYVDFGKPWWNDDITNGFAAFGRLYNVTGDLSYLSFGSVMCLLFNKQLFKELSLDYPYPAVEAGDWTLDRFTQIIKSGSSDLNGDGAMKPDEDRYGLYMANEWGYPIAILYCGGDRVIALDEDKIPYLSLYNERTVDLFDRLFDMLASESACLGKGVLDIKRYPIAQTDVFKNSRALFLAATIESIVSARDMEDDIGILPLPKYEKSTPKYYSPLEGGVNLFIVPITSTDLERTSVIVEALSAEGHKKIMPEYYERALKGKFIRDDESADMLDHIKSGIVYDYGYFNITLAGDELAQTGPRLLASSSANFTSFYESKERAASANIAKMIAAME